MAPPPVVRGLLPSRLGPLAHLEVPGSHQSSSFRPASTTSLSSAFTQFYHHLANLSPLLAPARHLPRWSSTGCLLQFRLLAEHGAGVVGRRSPQHSGRSVFPSPVPRRGTSDHTSVSVSVRHGPASVPRASSGEAGPEGYELACAVRGLWPRSPPGQAEPRSLAPCGNKNTRSSFWPTRAFSQVP